MPNSTIDYSVQTTRTIWYDQTRIKNHPRNCKQHHRFCSIDYEWKDNNNTLHHMNRPINQNIYNVTLPNPKQQLLDIKYENITEQALDDWLCQSINRNINSILNPNKKFYIPSNLDEELKIRYKRQHTPGKPQSDDTYFKTRTISQQKSYLTHKKNKTLDLNQVCFDYTKLEAKRVPGKTLILVRQQKSQKPKILPKRRNAVLLSTDIHYQRFMKMQQKLKDPTFTIDIEEDRKITTSLNKNKIYTFNYESLKRRKQNQDAPGSITEYEGINIRLQDQKFSFQKGNRMQMRKQQQQQQAYRLKGNAQAQMAYSIMQNFSQRSRRTKRTKVSFSEQKSKVPSVVNNNFIRKLSTLSVLDNNNLLSNNKTLRKASLNSNPKPNNQKHVMKLLQDMHVESQHINVLMAEFDLHPQFLQLKIMEKDNLAHKWINKAQQQISKNNILKAHDCYKQAMIQNPDSFNPVYNFAAILERQNRLNCALDWFKMAKRFDTDNQKVTFAIALINLKMQKFQDCLNQINVLINFLTNQRKKIDIKYLYLRALCNKKFQKHEAARQDYKLVLQESRPQDYARMTDYLFSQIFAKKRRFKTNVDCLSMINFQEMALFCLYEKQNKLKDDMNEELIKRISELRFFRRFPYHLVYKIVNSATYQYVSKDQIIFVRPEQCIIVLDGLITVKNHQKNVFFHANITVLRSGDFVGADKIDNYRNKNLNNWYYAHTEIQLLRLKTMEFQSLWKGQITFQIDFKYNYLKNNALFENLCDATLFKLCELMKHQKYSQGTVLFNDCSYRNKLMSRLGAGFSLVRNTVESTQSVSKNIGVESLEQFSKTKFTGIFVVLRGKILIQDDSGFSNSDIISNGDFFGQNLVIKSDGFHNYGRLLVGSQEAEFYVLNLQDVVWCFSSQDKQQMRKNCQNMQKRKSLQLVKDLRKRYHQFLDIQKIYKRDQIPTKSSSK